MKTEIILILLMSMLFAENITLTVDSWQFGYGVQDITDTSIGGDDEMGGLILAFTLIWAVLWGGAAWLFVQKKPLFGYTLYLFGLLVLYLTVLAGYDYTIADYQATATLLLTFHLPILWLLVLSVLGLGFYIFMALVLRVAEMGKIHIDQWWFEGKPTDSRR